MLYTKQTTLKSLFLTAILALILTACEDEKPGINKLPSAPILLSPQNGEVVSSKSVGFTWQASSDPEKNPILYILSTSSDENTWAIDYQGTDTSFKKDDGYPKGQKVYWKVEARNNLNNIVVEEGESISSTAHFFTSPPAIEEFSDSSYNKTVALTWKDSPNMDYAEITFSPKVASIPQPITVPSGIQQKEISGLNNQTLYTFRIKAIDKNGSESEVDSLHSMPLHGFQVHDYDFNIYNIVTIGTQTWLRENLRTKHWRSGGHIEKNGLREYELPVEGDTLIGAIYSLFVARGGKTGIKTPCPCGYHIPTDEEWKTLERYIGMPEAEIDTADTVLHTSTFRGESTNSGNGLKTTFDWYDLDGNDRSGTDVLFFSVYPAGNWGSGKSRGIGYYTSFWAATHYASDANYARYFNYNSSGIARKVYRSGNQFYVSIRCIKD